MKNKILTTYAIAMTVAVIVLSIFLVVKVDTSGTQQDMTMQNETAVPTEMVTTSALTPTKTPSATPAPSIETTPNPTRTPYEPTEEEIAFKNMIIAEGETITLEISEWDMIDIFCNKMGWDEYLYRIYESDSGEYVLYHNRNRFPAANHATINIDPKTGDMYYSVGPGPMGNIFTMDNIDEPLRLPKGEDLIDLLVEKIIVDLPKGAEFSIDYTGSGDLMILYFENIDGEKKFIRTYYIDECTGDVYDVEAGEEYVGSLVD